MGCEMVRIKGSDKIGAIECYEDSGEYIVNLEDGTSGWFKEQELDFLDFVPYQSKNHNIIHNLIMELNNTERFECRDLDNEEFINWICKKSGLDNKTYMEIMKKELGNEVCLDIEPNERIVRKEDTLDLICAAINDCDNEGLKQTSETLRAALEDLEYLFKQVTKKELLQAEFSDPLATFIKREVPFRMEEIYQTPLTEKIKNQLIESVVNDNEIFIDYDKFDRNLLIMYDDMIRKEVSTYKNTIAYLCETLNKEASNEFETRTVEQFQPIFETENYFGVYWYGDSNEYYVIDKNDGSYQMVLGDSFVFVGKYLLDCLESETVLNVANKEILDWLVEFSRDNAKDILSEDKLKGVHVLENALIETIIDNTLDLLKGSYAGQNFDKWAEQELFVSQSDKENVLYNALTLLEERYEGNEDFVSWAENELGVSSRLLKKIGFLEDGENVKSSSLDEKMTNAKTRTNAEQSNKIIRDTKKMEFEK